MQEQKFREFIQHTLSAYEPDPGSARQLLDRILMLLQKMPEAPEAALAFTGEKIDNRKKVRR